MSGQVVGITDMATFTIGKVLAALSGDLGAMDLTGRTAVPLCKGGPVPTDSSGRRASLHSSCFFWLYPNIVHFEQLRYPPDLLNIASACALGVQIVEVGSKLHSPTKPRQG